MSVFDRPESDLCRPFRPGSVLFPERKTFHDHVDTCYQMRGEPTVIRSREEQDSLVQVFDKHRGTCSDNW